ncbi:hypothetical protein ACFL4G_04005 [Thermodesulfobacteriota bacterium]
MTGMPGAGVLRRAAITLLVPVTMAAAGCTRLANLRGDRIVLDDYQCFAPLYNPDLYPPETLLFSDIDLDTLRETAGFWRAEVGMDGFILGGIAGWDDDPVCVRSMREKLAATNRACAAQGITANFIKVSLGYGTLPAWQDAEAWKRIADSFGAAAELAHETGCRGILIDTEPYTVPLWNPEAPRFGGCGADLLRDAVRRAGAGVMGAMADRFPGIEIIVIPDGAYRWFAKGEGGYAFWIAFFNGLISAGTRGGVVVGAESSYHATDTQTLFRLYYTLNSIMMRESSDPVYWQTRCSIALGAWPLGYYKVERDERGRMTGVIDSAGEPMVSSKVDKSAYYTAEVFDRQFRTIESLCPRYAWIYAHGASWWQDDAGGLTHSAEVPVQALPTVPDIDQYYEVVRRSERPDLREYLRVVAGEDERLRTGP